MAQDDHKVMTMPEKQTDADKAKALQEYRAKHDAAIRRIAKLHAARLARDAALPSSNKRKKKSGS